MNVFWINCYWYIIDYVGSGIRVLHSSQQIPNPAVRQLVLHDAKHIWGTQLHRLLQIRDPALQKGTQATDVPGHQL